MRDAGVDSKQPILATLTMRVSSFMTQTYHLSTDRRVKLELGNNVRPIDTNNFDHLKLKRQFIFDSQEC